MRGRPLLRGVLVVALLAFVGWQLVDFAAHADARSVYPSDRQLDDDVAAYHGEEVDLWLTVAERTDDGFHTTNGWIVETGEGVPLPDRLDAGDSVQVYGIARPGETIEARRLALADSTNRAYMLTVSVLGLLLAVGGTLRHWRPSFATGSVQPRIDRESETTTLEHTGEESDD